MATIVTASQIRTRGVSRLEEVTEAGEAAIISVRGNHRFVVLSVEQYSYLRECEMEAAIAETERDLANGNSIRESVKDHIKRVSTT